MSSDGQEVTALQGQWVLDTKVMQRSHILAALLKLNLHFVFKQKGNLINIKVNCLSFHLKGH